MRFPHNQTGFWDMTLDKFRLALRRLRGYSAVIAIIGGNPCIHMQFGELCQVFQEEVLVKRRCRKHAARGSRCLRGIHRDSLRQALGEAR